MLHDISNTEKGSSIVNEGRLDYFGRETDEHQVSDDAAFLLRTSNNSSVSEEKDINGIHLPIENVASAFACFELRKKLGLLSKKAKLQYIFYGKGRNRSTVCSDHEEKLLDAILINEIGHVFSTQPNRINEDSIVVQTIIGTNRIRGFHFSKDSGKEVMSILRNEEDRRDQQHVLTNTCNADVELVEQSHTDEVTFDQILHITLKKVSFAPLPKRLVEQAEEYNNTTPLFPSSSLDLQHEKQLEECNDKAKTYLERHPKPKKKKKAKKKRATQKESTAILETWFNTNIDDSYPLRDQKEDLVARIMSFIKKRKKQLQHQQKADMLYSGINVSNADEVFDSINQVLSSKNGSKAKRQTINSRWEAFINRHENDTLYHLIEARIGRKHQSNTPVVAAPFAVGTLADLDLLYPTTKKKSKKTTSKPKTTKKKSNQELEKESTRLNITVAPGPLGVGIQTTTTGQCVVYSKSNAQSPLKVNDIILSLSVNGIELSKESGFYAWGKMFKAYSPWTRNLVVLRSSPSSSDSKGDESTTRCPHCKQAKCAVRCSTRY